MRSALLCLRDYSGLTALTRHYHGKVVNVILIDHHLRRVLPVNPVGRHVGVHAGRHVLLQAYHKVMLQSDFILNVICFVHKERPEMTVCVTEKCHPGVFLTVTAQCIGTMPD